MVAPIKPRKVQANGKDSWFLVPTVADITSPTVTEINSASGINLSCTFLKSFEGATAETSKVTLEEYLCETVSYEANDTTTVSIGDFVGGFDPQAAAESDDKAAFEFLRDGFVGYAVRRQAISAESGDVVAGQFVDVMPVEVAKALPDKSNTDSSGIYVFRAAASVTGECAWNVAAA